MSSEDQQVQKESLRGCLENNLKENFSKDQRNKILKFVLTYFGKDMKGQADKKEFKALVAELTEENKEENTEGGNK